jgi:hypothetical protein
MYESYHEYILNNRQFLCTETKYQGVIRAETVSSNDMESVLTVSRKLYNML